MCLGIYQSHSFDKSDIYNSDTALVHIFYKIYYPIEYPHNHLDNSCSRLRGKRLGIYQNRKFYNTAGPRHPYTFLVHKIYKTSRPPHLDN